MIRFNGRTNIEVLAFVQTSLQMLANIERQFPKQNSKERSQQGSRQVQSLFTKMITIIFFGPSQFTRQQLVNGIAQKESLFGFTVFFGTDVRQDFLLQNTTGISNSIVLGNISGRTTSSNKIEGHILTLNDKGFFQRRSKEIHHFSVGQIVDNVFDDIPIGNVPQSPKDNDDGNIGPNIGQRRSNLVAFQRPPSTPLLVHLQIQGTDGSSGSFDLRSRFNDPTEFGGLLLFKGVDVIVTETLLGNHDFFGSVNDKVSTLIVDAFSEIAEIGIVLVTQDTKQTPEHNGNVSQKFLLGVFGSERLAHQIGTGRIHNVDFFGTRVLVHRHIHIKRSAVHQIP